MPTPSGPLQPSAPAHVGLPPNKAALPHAVVDMHRDVDRSISLALASQQPATQLLLADLRSDHAGETGAVMIYRGILAVSRDAGVRAFAQAHLATETRHLKDINAVLARQARSRLLLIWRLAGWVTGALPSLIGPRAVYATIEAVETFVDRHYAEQIEAIDRLDPTRAEPSLQSLRVLLQGFQHDEIAHRDEATEQFLGCGGERSLLLRIWAWSVNSGSRLAVRICRRV